MTGWSPTWRRAVVAIVLRILSVATLCLVAVLPVGQASAQAASPGKILATGCSPRPAGSQCPPTRIWTMNPDGSELTEISPPGLSPGQGAWSPDGSRIAFVASGPGGSDAGIWIMNGNGSGAFHLPGTGSNDRAPSWSPDGNTILFTRSPFAGEDGAFNVIDVDSGDPPTELPIAGRHPTWAPSGRTIAYTAINGPSLDIFAVDADGTDPVNLTNTPNESEQEPDYAPNGQRIVFASGRPPPTGDDDGRSRLWIMNADGSNVTNFTNPPRNLNRLEAQQDFSPTWSPDGQEIAFERTHQNSTHFVMKKGLGDTTAVMVSPVSTDTVAHHFDDPDWQPVATPAPIVFVHGFAGSKIACGGDQLFPDIPVDFPSMGLEADGVTNRQGSACSALAAPTEILESFAGEEVYGPALEFLDEVAPGNNYIYTWDWRKSPRLALDGLDLMVERALCGGTLPSGETTCDNRVYPQVALMGHSMGGLVIRDYINQQERADKVVRALTLGTPYWGSPKAIFPLATGLESPAAEGLDNIIVDDEFQQWARTAQGLYFLYPSANFGNWLTAAGREPRPLDRTGLLSYVTELGGTPALLEHALDTHAQSLDGFKRNGVDFQAFVGSGLATVEKILFFRVEPNDYVKLTYAQGDGTVPVRSGTQGSQGTADPLGENIPIHYSCGVSHVPLPGAPSITPRIEDFLTNGSPIVSGPTSCSSSGFQIEIFEVDVSSGSAVAGGATPDALSTPPSVRAAGAAGTPMELEEAESAGLIQLIDLGVQKVIVTDSRTPVDLTYSSDHFELNATPLNNGSLGQTSYFGQLSGETTISAAGAISVADADGPAAPLSDGAPDASVPDTSGPEGAEATVSVNLSRASAFPMTVDFKTEDGTAIANSDYSPRQGTLVFKPGEQSKELRIPTAADDLAEASETFRVRLSNPLDLAITDAEATATIIDGNGGGGGDRTVDGADLRAAKSQKQKGKKIKVKIAAGADEEVTVLAEGRVKVKKASYGLKAVNAEVDAGETATLELKLKKASDAARIVKARRRGGKAVAAISVRFTDGATNSVTQKAIVNLK